MIDKDFEIKGYRHQQSKNWNHFELAINEIVNADLGFDFSFLDKF